MEFRRCFELNCADAVVAAAGAADAAAACETQPRLDSFPRGPCCQLFVVVFVAAVVWAHVTLFF